MSIATKFCRRPGFALWMLSDPKGSVMMTCVSTMEESMRVGWRHSLVGPRASRRHPLHEKSGRDARGPGPALLALSLIAGFSAQALSAEYLEGNERQKSRAYSPAVITGGGDRCSNSNPCSPR